MVSAVGGLWWWRDIVGVADFRITGGLVVVGVGFVAPTLHICFSWFRVLGEMAVARFVCKK